MWLATGLTLSKPFTAGLPISAKLQVIRSLSPPRPVQIPQLGLYSIPAQDTPSILHMCIVRAVARTGWSIEHGACQLQLQQGVDPLQSLYILLAP
jgi:hypothetical protein